MPEDKKNQISDENLQVSGGNYAVHHDHGILSRKKFDILDNEGNVIDYAMTYNEAIKKSGASFVINDSKKLPDKVRENYENNK